LFYPVIFLIGLAGPTDFWRTLWAITHPGKCFLSLQSSKSILALNSPSPPPFLSLRQGNMLLVLSTSSLKTDVFLPWQISSKFPNNLQQQAGVITANALNALSFVNVQTQSRISFKPQDRWAIYDLKRKTHLKSFWKKIPRFLYFFCHLIADGEYIR